MRASRLLRILLILQNRGRVTTLQLAEELEVARRTVMRDLDALTESGLPIVVRRGNTGGVELGFNYRSRFVGLSAAEAEALGLLLVVNMPMMAALGMEQAAQLACDKLVESMPEIVRQRIKEAQCRFRVSAEPGSAPDVRVPALAAAVRTSAMVRIRSKAGSPRTIHPVALEFHSRGWLIIDALDPQNPIPMEEWGDINISARRFD
ncbi:MAG: HTH domain-containing protein [Bryobacterales bacterium]|nr:HTH domain-containing protein [Bryobacterales bacterium]